MKKVYISILISSLLVFNFYNPVYAEPKYSSVTVTYATIVVQATVPDNFDRTIYVNFIAEDGTNREYTLTKANDYVLEDKIKTGNNNINFITIGNNQDNKYGYSINNDNFTLVAEKGKSVVFAININENNEYKEKQQENKKEKPAESDEIKEDTNNNNKVQKKDTTNDINKSIEDKKETNAVIKLIINILINIVGFLLLGLVVFIYLYIKKKKEENE